MCDYKSESEIIKELTSKISRFSKVLSESGQLCLCKNADLNIRLKNANTMQLALGKDRFNAEKLLKKWKKEESFGISDYSEDDDEPNC